MIGSGYFTLASEYRSLAEGLARWKVVLHGADIDQETLTARQDFKFVKLKITVNLHSQLQFWLLCLCKTPLYIRFH